MRDNGRRINFIGLTGTMLSNDDASALASALKLGLNSLAGREATLASQESQKIPESAETCSAPGAGGDPGPRAA